MTDRKHSWWQTGVFYIVYVRSFRDANGDGVGDLADLTEKMDYLSDTLGVDAIWVAAVYPSPMADFGYDVSDYTDILLGREQCKSSTIFNQPRFVTEVGA